MKYKTTVLSILAFSIGAYAGYHITKDYTKMIDDPLKLSGLSDYDIRWYRYLHALQRISHIDKPPMSNKRAEAEQYLKKYKAVQCSKPSIDGVLPGCDRLYINEINSCPEDGFPTRALDPSEFTRYIAKWDNFRQRYADTSRIKGLTREWAIRLCYLMSHPLEG